MPRQPLSISSYMNKVSEYHARYSAAFLSLPERAEEEHFDSLQRALTMIADFHDFYDDFCFDRRIHPRSSDPNTSIYIIKILFSKISRLQKEIMTKIESYPNINIVFGQNPPNYEQLQ